MEPRNNIIHHMVTTSLSLFKLKDLIKSPQLLIKSNEICIGKYTANYEIILSCHKHINKMLWNFCSNKPGPLVRVYLTFSYQEQSIELLSRVEFVEWTQRAQIRFTIPTWIDLLIKQLTKNWTANLVLRFPIAQA